MGRRGNSNMHGTPVGITKAKEGLLADEKKGKNEKDGKKKSKSTWHGLWRKSKLLFPFMWPKGQYLLQLRIIFCMLILLAMRGVAVLIPIFYKKIVDSLTVTSVESASAHMTEKDNKTLPTTSQVSFGLTTSLYGVSFRWDLIVIHVFLKAMHGGGGFLSCLRSLLWIRVSQNTKKKLRLQLFSHLHSLSMRWHLQRKTGEVLRVMDRGVNSINLIVNQVLFNLFPVIADIVIAVVFFLAVFNVYTGMIVIATMVGYVVCTVGLNEWRTKYRRKMNDKDNHRNATSVDSILNFETVKYFAAEDAEAERYAIAVDQQQEAEWIVLATMNLLNACQKTMMTLGLLGGSLLCAWYVSEGKFTVGDYVLFTSYLEQLYGPLNQFGSYYRILQTSFVDMENMFEMLAEKQEVVDEPDAPDLKVQEGAIEFNNVSFYYTPEKPILTNINFAVPPGQTYGLVGHSGGGKSTILRLLFRFYDIQSGTVKIDGQDISKVTQKSLRSQVGVVPQDTVLFNQNIRDNIRYGRFAATDKELEEAASAADIHEKILTFPEGYDSKVGERGLKLSGGEKQRVAIARTILKSPEVVLLDEATSALDTRTERNIQNSLSQVCHNRTTLIVAHRLSTIIHAHQILVIKDGAIVERGTHDDLIAIGGLYSEMWREQLKSGELSEETSIPNNCQCQKIKPTDEAVANATDHKTCSNPKTRNNQLTNQARNSSCDDTLFCADDPGDIKASSKISEGTESFTDDQNETASKPLQGHTGKESSRLNDISLTIDPADLSEHNKLLSQHDEHSFVKSEKIPLLKANESCHTVDGRSDSADVILKISEDC